MAEIMSHFRSRDEAFLRQPKTKQNLDDDVVLELKQVYNLFIYVICKFTLLNFVFTLLFLYSIYESIKMQWRKLLIWSKKIQKTCQL